MKTAVIIPAAGTSVRMGTMKQLLILKDRPVLAHTLAAFENHRKIDEIIMAAPENVAEVIRPCGFKKLKAVVKGGGNRQASVLAGLMAVSPDVGHVLIHDGARPLVSRQVISDVLEQVRCGRCAVSGVKSKDTIKIADENNVICDTPNRGNTWIVQTPQGFPLHIIKEAHLRALSDGFVGTDDAILVERIGFDVYMVEGDYRNIKLTTPEDVPVAMVHMDGEF